MLLRPALSQSAHHAHRTEGLGVAEGGLDPAIGGDRIVRRRLEMAARRQFVAQRKAEDDQTASGRDIAEPGMQDEAAGNEDRHPGRIAKRDQPGARTEFAHGVQIANALGVTASRSQQTAANRQIEHAVARPFVEERAEANEESGTAALEHRVNQEQKAGDQRQEQKRRLVPARDDAIIDLHHVEGTDESQHIDEERKDDGADEARACRRKRGLQWRLWLTQL